MLGLRDSYAGRACKSTHTPIIGRDPCEEPITHADSPASHRTSSTRKRSSVGTGESRCNLQLDLSASECMQSAMSDEAYAQRLAAKWHFLPNSLDTLTLWPMGTVSATRERSDMLCLSCLVFWRNVAV